ncbi:phytohormone-binding protein-like [Phalaenopsis equestris]|uniref:phytohormone-binding protein-like n=1 Tax=Phalaenopsis equestris TaxID=78828 RepID=UPI0009E4EBC9|nr:phytohormone-binding protein-like [Phalaenopsis equestris]
MTSIIEFQTEFEIGIEDLWNAITKAKFDVLRKAAPHLPIDAQVVESDGGPCPVVSITIRSATPPLSPFKEKMVKYDETSHAVSFQAIDGGLLELGFAYYNVSFKLDDLGEDKTLTKTTIIYEIVKDFDGTQVVKEFAKLIDEYIKTVVNYLQQQKLQEMNS